MPTRASRVAAVALACVLGACSTPRTGRDDLATGKERVQALVEEVLAALPATKDYQLPDAAGEQTCRKTFLGYAVGTTGAKRAEMPVIVALPAGVQTRPLLDTVEAVWEDEGYDVSRLRTADERFPKIQAVGDGYRVVMTAFTDTPQITVYAVSPCLRES